MKLSKVFLIVLSCCLFLTSVVVLADAQAQVFNVDLPKLKGTYKSDNYEKKICI